MSMVSHRTNTRHPAVSRTERPFSLLAACFSAIVLIVSLLSGCKVSPGDIPGGVAVVYGIAAYVNLLPEDQLVNTRYDAEDMEALLQSKGYDVILRIDNDYGIEATTAQLELDIQTAASMVGPNENFLFFFSGHGAHVSPDGSEGFEPPPSSLEGEYDDAGDEWLFFYQAELAPDYASWSADAINEERLLELLSAVPTDRKFVVLDACNSGGFIGTSADADLTGQDYDLGGVGDGIARSLNLYLKYPENTSDIPYTDAIVLSAAGEREFSWESGSIGHGVFTYFFLQSASRGDLNGDGAVTVDEAYGYIAEQIQINWNDELNAYYEFHPHISGGPVTYVLFSAD